MPATSAGMTGGEALHEENGAKHKRRKGGSHSSWPGIAVQRTVCFRPPMSRPSTSLLWQGGKTWMPGPRPGMTGGRHCTSRIKRRNGDSHSSWPGLSRPSTSLFVARRQGVDARDKRGHDGGEALHEENGAKHKRRNGGFPFVMAGYSRPKDGVLSPAYVPAIHVFALVMAGLVPAIHVFSLWQGGKTWMPGTRPGMTAERHAQTQRIIQRRQFSTASWPGIAVQRTACFRPPMSRPSTTLLLSWPGLSRPSTSLVCGKAARRGCPAQGRA